MNDAQKLIIIRAKAQLYAKRKPNRTPATFPLFDESNKGQFL